MEDVYIGVAITYLNYSVDILRDNEPQDPYNSTARFAQKYYGKMNRTTGYASSELCDNLRSGRYLTIHGTPWWAINYMNENCPYT